MAISTGAAILGSAAIGALAGGKSQGGGTTTQNSEPWSEQKPFLKYGFEQSQDAYKNAIDMGAYTGPRVAGLNPFQTQGANFTGSFANSMGQPLAQGMTASGLYNLMNTSGFGQNAADIYGRTTGDPTQSILNTAGQYANNPYVDGMIDASSRDVTRQLNEQALPSLARGLAGSGNTNNTRGGVESAILQRGAADRLADVSNNIRGEFFGQGLRMGQNQYNQNLQNMLNANQGLLQGYNSSGNMGVLGQQAAGNVFDQSLSAGGVFQGQNQMELDAARSQFTEQRDFPLEAATSYMRAVDGNYGGTQTSTAPKTGGGLSGALMGGLGGAMGAYGTLGKLGGFGTTQSFAPNYSLFSGGSGLGLKI